MKSVVVSSVKFLSFFILCMGIVLITPVFVGIENKAFDRLVTELVPLIFVILLTLFYVKKIEKNDISVNLSKHSIVDSFLGIGFGMLWIGLILGFLFIGDFITIGKMNTVEYLWVYIIALLLNTVMQEYLVRGYVFSMLRYEYGTLVAVISSTILFSFFHMNAFFGGLLSSLNVISMGLFITSLLLLTDGLLVPMLAHFIWSLFGGIITNSISLPYPFICEIEAQGSVLISGGELGIENSVLTLIFNLVFAMLFFFIASRRNKNRRLFY